ncbi:universal stress protein [Cupriavidus consociatus]|uniref:universal stress protein n=1 Tax=Cupriavidus consociatus TaxID=2821357 RepID=UPI001AE3D981|nr:MULTISPECIES: universal stress protein [unclassified Cupriavidus]MBP0620879.1 universal stress protein [Cupriavidus sp. LEh25]MDK2657542.1 universal stress protein [Cupriavidus sp. LEh21]
MVKHMLVAVDGSALSDTAYRKAIELARPLKASITAMQVVAHYDVMRLQTALLQDTRARYMEEAYRQAEEYLASIANEAAAAGVTCDTVCLTGDHIFQAILDEAEARKCDLIVMASHGRRGLQALLIGSETQRVLTHTKIPVLVYR